MVHAACVAVSSCAGRNAYVVATVFWGRQRYVELLELYLRRNLRANGGVIDELLLITNNRDSEEGLASATGILNALKADYPDAVKAVPFCAKPYGCAFDDIMVDPRAVYVKLDDDLVFIKDGSFEHLVYQMLFHGDAYTFFSGSVVNHPLSYGVHLFAGAYPLRTFHFDDVVSAVPPFYNNSHAAGYYFG